MANGCWKERSERVHYEVWRLRAQPDYLNGPVRRASVQRHSQAEGAIIKALDDKQRSDWGLPLAYARGARRCLEPLAAWLERYVALAPRVPVVAIAGSQGSGKSTLVKALREMLELRVATMSLDDFYFSRARRQALASTVHPLLATRGVPGTHDVAMARQVQQRLCQADAREIVAVPGFSKLDDEVVPSDRWLKLRGPFDLVLVEGWCLGCPPQTAEALRAPVNALERERDVDGRWRAFVNRQLEGAYRDWFASFDALVFLRVPGFDRALEWRRKQEHALAQRSTGQRSMDDAAVARFVAHFERLTCHMLDTLPTTADAVITLDHAQALTDIAFRDGAVRSPFSAT